MVESSSQARYRSWRPVPVLVGDPKLGEPKGEVVRTDRIGPLSRGERAPDRLALPPDGVLPPGEVPSSASGGAAPSYRRPRQLSPRDTASRVNAS